MNDSPTGSDNTLACPVCTESYSDPRILHCGHHFCLPCLEKIASGHPDGHIICPTCRHLTGVTDVNTLSEYKISEFEEKAREFISKESPKVDKPCIYCKTESCATVSCLDCFISFCDGCSSKHQAAQEVSKHRVVPITSHQFCKQHPEWFIQWICEQCSVGSCHLCLHEHQGHKPRDLRTIAAEARAALSLEEKKMATARDERVMQRIEGVIKEYIDLRTNIRSTIKHLREQLQKLLKDADQIEKEYEELMKIELKKLEMLQFDAREFMRTKHEMGNYIKKLSHEVSEAELFFTQKNYPAYASSALSKTIGLRDHIIIYPNLKFLKSIKDTIDSCSLKPQDNKQNSVTFDVMNLHQGLNLFHSVKVAAAFPVNRLLQSFYINENNTVVIVTDANILEIFSVDTGGKLGKIELPSNFTVSQSDAIAFDSKRKLIIVATSQGSLLVINLDGKCKGTADITSRKEKQLMSGGLLGAAYCEEKDIYITSCKNHSAFFGSVTIVIIEAENTTKVRYFEIDAGFYRNCRVQTIGCGYDNDKTTSVIYMLFETEESVVTFDFDGHKLYEYRSLLWQKNVQIVDFSRYAHGLCLGAHYNWVCDSGSGRVIQFWKKKNMDYKKTIINQKMFKQKDMLPMAVFWSYETGELHVCCTNENRQNVWINSFRAKDYKMLL